MVMELVKVKTKYQITLPSALRKKTGVKIGDIFEARVEKEEITLKPKRVIDRDIQESLDEAKAGKLYGPFKTHSEFLAFLHESVKKYKTKKRGKRHGHPNDA